MQIYECLFLSHVFKMHHMVQAKYVNSKGIKGYQIQISIPRKLLSILTRFGTFAMH